MRRWTRLATWAALGVVGLLAYFNWVGLPRFLWAPLLSSLSSRGIQLQIDRLKLQGFRQIALRGVVLLAEMKTQRAEVRLEEMEIRFAAGALLRARLEPVSILARNGRGRLSSIPPSDAPGALVVDQIQAHLIRPARQTWRLHHFDAKVFGAQLRIHGRLAHAAHWRDWLPSLPEKDPKEPWFERWARAEPLLSRVQFGPSSVLSLDFDADGQAPDQLRAAFHLRAPDAQTPWGRWQGLHLEAGLSAAPEQASGLQLALTAGSNLAVSRWGELHQSRLSLQAKVRLRELALHELAWKVESEALSGGRVRLEGLAASASTRLLASQPRNYQTQIRIQARSASAGNASLSPLNLRSDLLHDLGSKIDLAGDWTLETSLEASPWGTCPKIQLSGALGPNPTYDPGKPFEETWGPWAFLEPLDLSCRAAFDPIRSPNLDIAKLGLTARWHAPDLFLDECSGRVGEGEFRMSAKLHVPARTVSAEFSSNFDPHLVNPLLTTNAQRWLGQYAWQTPPKVDAAAGLILPPWSVAKPNWRQEVLPTLTLSGRFEGVNGAFRGIEVSSARSEFSLTNLVWRLPNLQLARPDGSARLSYSGHMFTRDFVWEIDSAADPRLLRPLLEENSARGLDYFEFSEPPRVSGMVWGRWKERDRLGAWATVAASNFVFRGEPIDQLEATLQFTNLFLRGSKILVRRGGQHATVSEAGYDPASHLLFLTNAVGVMDPQLVSRLIGPKTQEALAPYVFNEPPRVRANGQFPTRPESEADARFEVEGRDFEYWKFRVPDIAGHLHWKADTLSISNVQARFYGGHLDWKGFFDFTGQEGAQFNFEGTVTNTDLRRLMDDVSSGGEAMEGFLNGFLSVTNAHSRDWRSWQGEGQASLRDGFLWNIPIFGFLSPILSRLAPGLANSRVSSGSATFAIDHGVIRTSDLELRSPAMRLQYEGDVDFQGRVHARMQAEIFRDAWAVGRAVSLALWPIAKALEYRITGTLSEPRSEPIYVPKILMWPFRPVKALKDVISITPIEPLIESLPFVPKTD